MAGMKAWLVALLGACLGGAIVYALLTTEPRARRGPARDRVAPLTVHREAPRAEGGLPAAPRDLRVLIVGGGSTPESTEMQLEADVALAKEVLPSPSHVLFAGGTASQSVRTLAPRGAALPLETRLAEFFAPRAGRTSRYRAPRFEAAPATYDGIADSLAGAKAAADSPLLLYFATHGYPGDVPALNGVTLWGGDGLTALDLTELLAKESRPVRVVSSACFSGGFAAVVWQNGEPPAVAVNRCGFFAGDAARETTGCDPNPDRRAHDGYSLYFLHALRGEDAHGAKLPLTDLDYDADGRISLLDAHTRAAVASESIDIPNTTSEALLTYFSSTLKTDSAGDPALSPHDAAVIRILGAKLASPTREAARRLAAGTEAARIAAAEAAELAAQESDAAVFELTALLLGRWPVLDDAAHPDFAAMVSGDRAAIEAALERSSEARAFADAEDARAEADAALDQATIADSMARRLHAAHEHVAQINALQRLGGKPFADYERVRACEYSAP